MQFFHVFSSSSSSSIIPQKVETWMKPACYKWQQAMRKIAKEHAGKLCHGAWDSMLFQCFPYVFVFFFKGRNIFPTCMRVPIGSVADPKSYPIFHPISGGIINLPSGACCPRKNFLEDFVGQICLTAKIGYNML